MKETINIIVLIAVYKRHEVTKVCFRNLKRVIEKRKGEFNISVFCLVSNDEDKELVKRFGFEFTYVTNKPISNKMNTGLRSIENKQFDYIMQLGSDDIVHESIFDLYGDCFENGVDYFGLQDYFLIEPRAKKAKYWKYDVNHPIGAGRCISHDLLKELKYKIYSKDKNIGLDTNSDCNLLRKGYKCKLVNSKYYPFIIDIKTGENLHSFNDVSAMEVSYNGLKEYMDGLCVGDLETLEALTGELS